MNLWIHNKITAAKSDKFKQGGWAFPRKTPVSLLEIPIPLLPPIQVQSDPPTKGVSTFVSHYSEEDELLPPPPSLISALDWISFSQESALIPFVAFNPHALQPLEEQSWPKWHEPISLKLEEPRIQLAISGDLA